MNIFFTFFFIIAVGTSAARVYQYQCKQMVIPERPTGSVVSTNWQWKNEENIQVVQKGYRGFLKKV